jgi:RNA polymerase sigma factor (sigma-70 family)
MTGGKPLFPWPGVNERLVVEEMIRDRYSKHWEECNKLVKRCVYARAKNILSNLQEDILQEAMYKVAKYLPHFRFQCALKTWLNQIVEGCIIDAHRWQQNKGRSHPPLADPSNEGNREGEGLSLGEAKSAEDAFETNHEIRNGIAALLEYVHTHSNKVRNRLIIRMVIFEGRTYEEAAQAAGCHAPVVGYVVREAQRYARERMGHML